MFPLTDFVLSGWLNKTKVHNRETISTLLDNRPINVPLVTISNHHSCFDDPGIWGKNKKIYVKEFLYGIVYDKHSLEFSINNNII